MHSTRLLAFGSLVNLDIGGETNAISAPRALLHEFDQPLLRDHGLERSCLQWARSCQNRPGATVGLYEDEGENGLFRDPTCRGDEIHAFRL